jgi:hypothetical protein
MDSPLLDQHARINAVRVDGAKNTRRSFLASLVYPHLPQSPHSFESVLRATRDIGHYLVQSDLFQSVHARLEPSADPAAKPGDVDVIFNTRERPRFFLKTSTEVGNSEGNAVRIHSIPRTLSSFSLLPRARQVEYEMFSVVEKRSKRMFRSAPRRVVPSMPRSPHQSPTPSIPTESCLSML